MTVMSASVLSKECEDDGKQHRRCYTVSKNKSLLIYQRLKANIHFHRHSSTNAAGGVSSVSVDFLFGGRLQSVASAVTCLSLDIST